MNIENLLIKTIIYLGIILFMLGGILIIGSKDPSFHSVQGLKTIYAAFLNHFHLAKNESFIVGIKFFLVSFIFMLPILGLED